MLGQRDLDTTKELKDRGQRQRSCHDGCQGHNLSHRKIDVCLERRSDAPLRLHSVGTQAAVTGATAHRKRCLAIRCRNQRIDTVTFEKAIAVHMLT